MLRSSFRASLLALITASVLGAKTHAQLPLAEGPDPQSEAEISAHETAIRTEFSSAIDPRDLSIRQRNEILNRYKHVDPPGEIPRNLLEDSLIFFEANRARFANQSSISIVDFAARSNRPRFFVVHLDSGEVTGFRTSHGVNSDVDHDGLAESFSNVEGSLQSSLGFVRVAELYHGKYGRSLRLDGLSETNFNIRRRAIVIHGADYVKEIDAIQGRSEGCFTLAWGVKDNVVDWIHSGSLLYAGLGH